MLRCHGSVGRNDICTALCCLYSSAMFTMFRFDSADCQSSAVSCNEALSVTMFSVTMFGDRCVGRLCGPGILNSARCFNVHVAQAPWLRSRLGVCLSCSSPGCGCCRVFAHRPTSCCEREAPGQPPAQPEQRYVAFEATPHQKNRLERVSEEQLTINEQGRPNSV